MKGVLFGIRFLSVVGTGLLFWACASYANGPTGGPKDELPPRLMKAQPQNPASHFNVRQIDLIFDEYVQLQNTHKIQVNPKLKGVSYTSNLKTVSIKIEDTLLENVTYNVNFKKSLVDFHESNPLTNFTYVFTTGSVIDSHYIEGYVYDAYTLKPVEEADVFIYKEKFDTFPNQQLPVYEVQADEKAYFKAEFLKEGEYYVVALKDANKNRLPDLNEEGIAYTTNAVSANRMLSPFQTLDSNTPAPVPLRLLLYQDYLDPAYLKKNNFARRGLVEMDFNFPVEKLDSLRVVAWDSTHTEPLSVCENWRQDRQGMELYFEDMEVEELRVYTVYHGYADTLELKLPLHMKKRTDTVKFVLDMNCGSRFNHADSLSGKFSWAVKYLNPEYLQIVEMGEKDTLSLPFSLLRKNNRDFVLATDWKPGKNYSVTVYPGFAQDCFGRSLDTSYWKFSCPIEDAYAILEMEIDGLDSNKVYGMYLVQGKDRILRTRRLEGNGKVVFRNLPPANYRCILFEDENSDGVWTSGRYEKQRQPETLWIYPKELKLEADWTFEESWTIVPY